MTQPPAFLDKDKPEFVCHLKKAIYILKQAPQVWYNELKMFLLRVRFTTSLGDTSVFTLQSGPHFFYMLIYVDDIVVTGSCSKLVNEIIATLARRSCSRIWGTCPTFLVLEGIGLHLVFRSLNKNISQTCSLSQIWRMQSP